jgi:hypothetical protein
MCVRVPYFYNINSARHSSMQYGRRVGIFDDDCKIGLLPGLSEKQVGVCVLRSNICYAYFFGKYLNPYTVVVSAVAWNL